MPEKKDLFNSSKHEYEKQKDERTTPDVSQNERGEKLNETEIKNAHATGIGALERSEENKIETMTGNHSTKNDAVY